MENEVYRAKPKKTKRITGLPIVLLFFGCYIFLQAYLMNANGIDTVKASQGYINDSIISQGIICRDEVVLTRNGAGAVDYLVSDGDRVSKGKLLADIYPSYTDIRNLTYLRNMQSTLEDINLASGFLDSGTIDMSATKKQLSSQLSGLSTTEILNDFQSLDSKLSEIALSLNKISVATGKTSNFTAAENQLKSEIAACRSLIGNVQDRLYSSYTGYFIQSTDGYENIATVDNFLNMSCEEGMSILNADSRYSRSKNEYGKIITDYKWNLCTYIDNELAKKLYEGKSVKISIDVKRNEYRKATVKHIENKGEKTLVVIQCTSMSTLAAKARITDCEILFKQYEGIKIPKSALRFDGEQMGVYVNFSNLVQFKKITPVYEDENYVVIPIETTANNQVKLHDSIIVKGRNLYDGKYL